MPYYPKVGEKVKIVDVHNEDAFYSDRHKYIGFTGEVTTVGDGVSADKDAGFLCLYIKIGEHKERCFYGVKVEPLVPIVDYVTKESAMAALKYLSRFVEEDPDIMLKAATKMLKGK